MDLIPKFRSEKFHCPHCQVASQQSWFDADSSSDIANKILDHTYYDYRSYINSHQQNAISAFIERVEDANNQNMSDFIPEGFSIATCSICDKFSLWVSHEIVYPKQTAVAPPNEDMNQEIQDLYIEASTIVIDSPKGATALLR